MTLETNSEKDESGNELRSSEEINLRQVVLNPDESFDALAASYTTPPEPQDLPQVDEDDDGPLPEGPIPEWRQNKVTPYNEAGRMLNKKLDKCFHLNASWKGGVCTIQGSQACPFLGGNQQECPYFADRETETERRASLPQAERYRLDHVNPRA